MTSTCLRCDWEEPTDREGCPRCGAPLYRVMPRVAPRSGSPDGAETLPGRGPADDVLSGPRPFDAFARQGGPWRVLVGLASAAVVLAIVWALFPGVQRSEGGRAGSARAPGPTTGSASRGRVPPIGRLLYASDPDGRGRQSLWTLDLSGAGAFRGPRIPPAVALNDASLAAPGWVGVTVRGRDGVLGALVLTGTEHGVLPRPVGSGDLVAWAPRGDVVVLGHRRPASSDRCAGAAIELVHVTTGLGERELGRPALCGHLLALGRDIITTYFSARSGSRVGTYAVGIGVAHEVLMDHELQGVSPTTDFLMLPVDGRGSGLPGRGTVLYWPGRGGPLAFGRRASPLRVERVLAWSQDGSRAAVLGRGGTRRGVFLLDTSAGAQARRPGAYVAGAGRSTTAAFARDGTLYVQVDGLLLRYREGETELVPLPSGAPRPVGPILWLP